MVYDSENIFKKIIDKEVPADIVYEDEMTLAILDIRPIELGHTLVLPKEEAVTVLDLSEEARNAFWKTADFVSKAVIRATDADGCNLTTNIGESAGQEVFHTHAHIIPRKAGKERTFTRSAYKDGEADEMRERIITALKAG